MASARGQRLASIFTTNTLNAANAENKQNLDQGYGKAEDLLHDNAWAGLDAIGAGQTQAIGALNAGTEAAKGSYGQAISLYQPYADAGTKALSAYEDAAGLNGATGSASAHAAFSASPGYEYTQEQAADTTGRKAAALGIAGSGNTLAAINSGAAHLADQGYNDYLGRLQGLTTLGYGATGAQAGLTKGIGDLSAANGTAAAGIYNTDGIASGSIYSTLGSNLAGVETGHANQVASSNMQAATGSAAAVTGAGEARDAAANANDNLLLGLGGLGVNLLTGKSGSGLLGSIGGGSKTINGASWT